jgi:hypothetical protein
VRLRERNNVCVELLLLMLQKDRSETDEETGVGDGGRVCFLFFLLGTVRVCVDITLGPRVAPLMCSLKALKVATLGFTRCHLDLLVQLVAPSSLATPSCWC